jgi:hypothetical protein
VATSAGASPHLSQNTISRWSVRPRLIPLTVAMLVFLALASDWHTLRLMIARRYYAGDVLHVGAYERRFDAIRPFLPQRGMVGYLSDRMDAGEQYYLTQYALAPLLVAWSPEHMVVVGNFFDPRSGPILAHQHGLVVVRDFGQGLLLLRRATK